MNLDEGQLLVDAWFETPASLRDPYLPIGLAVCWIAWRDSVQAESTWEEFRRVGRRLWLDPPDSRKGEEPRDAEKALRDSMLSGSVKAFGERDGAVQSIEPHEWIGLRFFRSNPADKMDSAVTTASSIVYTSLLVLSADVFKLWPRADEEARQAVVPRTKNTPGRKPVKSVRILQRMKAMDPELLDSMKFVAMAAEFGAAATYCDTLRKRVQAGRLSIPSIRIANTVK